MQEEDSAKQGRFLFRVGKEENVLREKLPNLDDDLSAKDAPFMLIIIFTKT